MMSSRFIDPQEYGMDLCNESCSSGRPAGRLRGKNFNFGHYTLSVQPQFSACHAYRYHWFLPFYTAFTDVELAWGSQGQRIAKPLGFVFSDTFRLIRMKFGVVSRVFVSSIQYSMERTLRI